MEHVMIRKFPAARVVRTELDLWALKENLACHFLCTYILLWLMTFAWSNVSGNHGGRGLLVWEYIWFVLQDWED